eukprot:m.263856 g.263856  ORF g.263856 m.263856 type:complete len:393 (-) comp52751_c0_seq1:155-1333(-)
MGVLTFVIFASLVGINNANVDPSAVSAKPHVISDAAYDQAMSLAVAEHTAEVKTLLRSLKGFVGVNHAAPLMSFAELKRHLLPILRGGLTLLGDSTTRSMFVFIQNLMNGCFDIARDSTSGTITDGEGGSATDRRKFWKSRAACSIDDQEVKAKCNSNESACDGLRAVFTHNDDLVLEFRAHTRFIDRLDTDSLRTKAVYASMPCLHSLWSPGMRENFCGSASYAASLHLHSRDWLADIAEFASAANSVMIGTTTGVCDSKRGDEGTLIRLFNRGASFGSQPNAAGLVASYNRGVPLDEQLPPNFDGLVPARDSQRTNTTMYNQFGALDCTLKGLLALQEASASFHPAILDMGAATSPACDDHWTHDGIHRCCDPLRKQVQLLLEGHTLQTG